VSCDVERQDAPADFTHGVLTCEKIIAQSVAKVAFTGIVLVQGIILAGVDADHRGARRAGDYTTNRAYEY
jgi:hypothetical protein